MDIDVHRVTCLINGKDVTKELEEESKKLFTSYRIYNFQREKYKMFNLLNKYVEDLNRLFDEYFKDEIKMKMEEERKKWAKYEQEELRKKREKERIIREEEYDKTSKKGFFESFFS